MSFAQREALQVPEDDRQIRYIEYKAEHFAVSEVDLGFNLKV